MILEHCLLRVDYGDRCVEAFFYHLHAAHTLVLPNANLLTLLKAKPMDHLEAATRYVGSFYVPQAPTAMLDLEAEKSVCRMGCPRDLLEMDSRYRQCSFLPLVSMGTIIRRWSCKSASRLRSSARARHVQT